MRGGCSKFSMERSVGRKRGGVSFLRRVGAYRSTIVYATHQRHTATGPTRCLTRSWMAVMEDQTEDACSERHRTSSRDDSALNMISPFISRRG